MTILNFGHPFTREQLTAIETLLGAPIERIIDEPAQFDPAAPFGPQAQALVNRAEISAAAWQTEPLVVNLPALNVIAALVLAEIHGRTGYFPAILRLRPVTNATPPRFEVAEILNLQAIRDGARGSRGQLPR